MIQFLSCVGAVPLAVYLLPGVMSGDYIHAAIAGAVLGLIHVTIRPIARIRLKVFNWITLGLLFIVLDAFLVLLCALLVPQYLYVASIWWALGASLLINGVKWLLKMIFA